MKKTFGILALLMSVTACGDRNIAWPAIDGNGIVHGRGVPTKSSISKSVVALVSEIEGGAALCTGTILDEQTILTAAHCVDHSPEKMVVVFDTKVKGVAKENLRHADTYLQNPRWAKGGEHAGDIAVVHFTGGLPKSYQPVQLATRGQKLEEGSEVTMVGYGMSNVKKESGGGVLRETKTTIVGKKAPDQIATDGHTSSVCFGDSGGPAFSEANGELVQWGVAHSVLNRECNETSLHTDIIPYEAWIRESMKRLAK